MENDCKKNTKQQLSESKLVETLTEMVINEMKKEQE